ncbi:hypothetical protein ACG2LH_05845 [Zhouia sp. PK063]|uniref:hypothetical protein n=1 Tax=Zhouia sp. PK063 TaxID=3373602 RepID=UPI0037940847
MKKLITLLFVGLFAMACSSDGEIGPQGPAGQDGADGQDAELSKVFEVENVNFDYDTDTGIYSTLLVFSDFTDFTVYNSDAVLVYRLEKQVEDTNGNLIDAWSLIPQNFFLSNGTIQYVYNHTLYDVEINIDGNFDLSTLSTDFTQNQIFRVVIVPAEEAKTVDVSDMNAVLTKFNITTINRLQ